MRQRPMEAGFILQTAQIQQQRLVLDAADDRRGRRRSASTSADRRAPEAGRMARAVLGRVSCGSAPEPIWLLHRQGVTVNCAPSRA